MDCFTTLHVFPQNDIPVELAQLVTFLYIHQCPFRRIFATQYQGDCADKTR